MSKKILVTGGAGFIGSNIVNQGLKLGHSITVLDNLSTGYIQNLNTQLVEFIQGDIRDRDLVFKLMESKDAVFHLAANVGNVKSIASPIDDSHTNILGTINILDAMVKNNIEKIVYSSTAAGYGEPKYLPVDEEHPMNPDSPYGVSKISAEKMVLCYSKIYGFHANCLRYFNAYGIHQRFDAYGNVIPIFFNKLVSNKPLLIYGDGEQTRDFINVRDIVNANWNSLNQVNSGYYNIATGVQCSINNLVQILKEITGESIEIKHEATRKGEVKHSVAQIYKAKNEIGFKPEVDLRSGLEEYWDWFKHDIINFKKNNN
jgi:UDP-glucose 4-epimerase